MVIDLQLLFLKALPQLGLPSIRQLQGAVLTEVGPILAILMGPAVS